MLGRAALLAAAVTAGLATPPAPTRWVTDNVGFLTPATRAALDARLEAYEKQIGHQVVVWIGDSLEGMPLDDFANRTFAAWQIGRKGHDDGVALFVFARDRKIAIEVGYGLEDKLPDALAGRIIRDVMAPRLRAGDNDGAITAAVDAILAATEGKPVEGVGTPVATPPGEGPAPSLGELIFFGILGIILLVVIIRHPHLLALFLSGMGRGGGFGGGRGGGGGGGFRGGGGRSGGGGARGGW